MTREQLISFANSSFLEENQKQLFDILSKALNNEQPEFIPYKENPIHYVLYQYHPLDLYYGLLGTKNLEIRLIFDHRTEIDQVLLEFFELTGNFDDIINDPRVIQVKREIEYKFLQICLANLESKLNRKIQLYLTEHITEVSYDLSNDELVDWSVVAERLEE